MINLAPLLRTLSAIRAEAKVGQLDAADCRPVGGDELALQISAIALVKGIEVQINEWARKHGQTLPVMVAPVLPSPRNVLPFGKRAAPRLHTVSSIPSDGDAA